MITEVSPSQLIVKHDSFPEGVHLEIKLSDDGAVFVELWDENAQEFTASRTITFDELLADADYLI